MVRGTWILALTILCANFTFSQLRGEKKAILAAEEMVEAMGGKSLWKHITQLTFRHVWYQIHRSDNYVEDELIDLTGPRSWVQMKSEIFQRVRAYSPEFGYWSVTNGKFEVGSEESLKKAMARSPFHFCRIARGIAMGDSYYEIKLDPDGMRGGKTLIFLDKKGKQGGVIVLNASNEPVVWKTNDYTYTFGPMKSYGNLRVPAWAVYGEGSFRYEMISLEGSRDSLDLEIFQYQKG